MSKMATLSHYITFMINISENYGNLILKARRHKLWAEYWKDPRSTVGRIRSL